MNKKLFFILILIGLIAGLTFTYQQFEQKSKSSLKSLPTYFSYDDGELNSIHSLKSNNMIMMKDLHRWEEEAFELVSKNKTSSSSAARFYAYLFTAQRDAAHLSFSRSGKFIGSIDPVSREVCCLFYAQDCSVISQYIQSDSYSEALADIVVAKIKARIEKDKKTVMPYPRKEGDQYWVARGVAQGKSVGSWNTWFIKSGQQFRIPPPPAYDSPEDKKQIQLAKNVYENLTDQQKRLVVTWAGGSGTKRLAGSWIKIASKHMKKKAISLDQNLQIKSIIAMGLADAYITANDSKYIYWRPRPHMRDSSIQTYMPTPNHPSYPSSAATVAGLASTLLNHYFPEGKDKWASLKQEAGNSRIWSGIHFPLDVEQGFQTGEKIAKEIIKNALDK